MSRMDRAITLLKACVELLEKQKNSHFVLNMLTETVFYDDAECDGYCLIEDIKAELEQPTVEEKHGRWIFNKHRAYGESNYFCSECVEGDSDTGYDNYCPNCGAKMDKEGEE